jgi:hypothetical protein
MAKPGLLCGHTLETCPNFKGNFIMFSSRYAKKYKATNAGEQSRQTGRAA